MNITGKIIQYLGKQPEYQLEKYIYIYIYTSNRRARMQGQYKKSIMNKIRNSIGLRSDSNQNLISKEAV